MEGTIFNVQRYSIHDGPGIRTTVFLKGCPLSCWWCHNPESQSVDKEIMYIENRCVHCGTCFKNCNEEAIDFTSMKPLIDDKKCTLCGECIRVCPTNALELVGKTITVRNLMKEIEKDLIFYDQSGGGVTFSGGEPLLQFEFLDSLLEACKKADIHTTVDTSGYTSWERLEVIASKTDLFLYDIKIMDDTKHKKYIGVSNDIILQNLKKLSKNGNRIFARLPIIPGINDDDDNINRTGKFLSNLRIEQVNILPYHSIAMDKYARLRKSYKLSGLNEPDANEIKEIASKLKDFNLNVKIGG